MRQHKCPALLVRLSELLDVTPPIPYCYGGSLNSAISRY